MVIFYCFALFVQKKKNDTEEAFDLIAVIGVQGKTGVKTSRMRQLKI